MSTTHERLKSALEGVRDRMLAEGTPSPADINCGRCGEVVSDVFEELGGVTEAYELGLMELGITNLMHIVDDEPEGFDREMLREHWPTTVPPEGMDWDDLDALAVFGDFSDGTHEWISFEGRHYDVEAVDGVDSPFDLPFFKRIVAAWQDERVAPTP